jgi:ATP-dependent Clp protease ATP-binding subunit ClpA
MFERFTDDARRVVVHAQEAARVRADHEIGAEHLLLGCRPDTHAGALLAALGVQDGQLEQVVAEVARSVQSRAGLADLDVAALRDLGVDVEEIISRVEGVHGAGALAVKSVSKRGWRFRLPGSGRPSGHIPLADSAKLVLERTVRETQARAAPAINSEHLLLALVSVGGTLADGLAERGVTAAKVRTALAAE